MVDNNKPYRYTKGKVSVEATLVLIGIGWIWKKAREEIPIQPRTIFYHPTALTTVTLLTALTIISPWLLLTPTLAVFAWFVGWPDSYIKHVHTRTQNAVAGFRYRRRIRRKLKSCALLNDEDPTPTISNVQKIGCITKVRVKMVDGDHLDMWRVRSAQLAQTYNALDCKVNPYRREVLTPRKHELVTKPRWLVLEFLTRDPFSSKLGCEYINYHQQDTFTPVVAVHRSGEPYNHNLAAHRLRVAMTQWGKSNAIRAMVYAQRHNIASGVLELWGIDGKGGVEQSFMQHVFARVAYGDTPLNPDAYHPAEFDRLLKDAVKVLKRRQRGMRGNDTHHTPTKKEPWLLIVIDELLVLTSKAVPPEMRNSIAASIMIIQQQGIACGVSLDASTQLAQKDRIDFRDGFTDFEVGKVERGAVDMIFGTGWWERGAKADEIAEDLKGAFYVKTDSTMVPTEIRYPEIPVSAVSAKALGFTVDVSALWLQHAHLKLVPPSLNGQHKPSTNGQHPQPSPQPVDEELSSVASAADDFGGFA